MSEIILKDNMTQIYNGDCRSMPELPDQSVHCVVTSPPYWSKRKYQGEQELVWGGDPNCGHQWSSQDRWLHRGSTKLPMYQKHGVITEDKTCDSFCSLCGAWRGALGLEPTPELFITHLVEIMREVRRVLRKDGTLWLDIGDSYNASSSGSGEWTGEKARQGDGEGKKRGMTRVGIKHPTIKPLDKVGIPEMLALALRADGWFWRSTVIWHKPSCMPESLNGWRWTKHRIKVGNKGRGKEAWRAETGQQDHDNMGNFQNDAIYQPCPGCPKCLPNDGLVLHKGSWRPTNDYEVILMLTKTGTYYCDKEAVAVISHPETWGLDSEGGYGGEATKNYELAGAENPSEVKRRIALSAEKGTRNLRSVWSFSSEASPTFRKNGKKLEHFAAFPEELPKRCILASTSEVGVCAKCGAPWARIVETKASTMNIRIRDAKRGVATAEEGYKASKMELANYGKEEMGNTQTLGWRATCKCGTNEKVGALVLDPFAGTFTTVAVAKKFGRRGVGYELSSDYCQMGVQRIQQTPSPFPNLY